MICVFGTGLCGETASGTRWARPDPASVEARRVVALGEANAAAAALGDAGYPAQVYGSVLRSASEPWGFHPHSDVDLLVVYRSDGLDPLDEQAGMLAIAESEVRSAKLSCLLVPDSQPNFIQPFDPVEILRRSINRLWERSCLLQRMVVRSGAAMTTFSAVAYQDAVGFQLGEVHKAIDRILKVIVHGHLGWLPAIEGQLTRAGYREVLVELAGGTAGTEPLISAEEVALFRAGYTPDLPPDARFPSEKVAAAVAELVPILCRLLGPYTDLGAHTPV